MANRMANVLYWTACIAAGAWLAFSYAGISTETHPDWSMFWIVGVVPSVIVWAIGRAIRYVLAGA